MVLVEFDGEQRLGQSEKSERQTIQRNTTFCKAIILQLKILKNNKIIYIYIYEATARPVTWAVAPSPAKHTQSWTSLCTNHHLHGNKLSEFFILKKWIFQQSHLYHLSLGQIIFLTGKMICESTYLSEFSCFITSDSNEWAFTYIQNSTNHYIKIRTRITGLFHHWQKK